MTAATSDTKAGADEPRTTPPSIGKAGRHHKRKSLGSGSKFLSGGHSAGFSLSGLGSSLVGGGLAATLSPGKSRNHNRKHSGKAVTSEENPTTKKRVMLKDLDYRHPPYLADVNADARGFKLASIVRSRRKDELNDPIPRGVPLHLYSEGREIDLKEPVGEMITVWYRVGRAANDGWFKFLHHVNGADLPMEPKLSWALVRSTEKGASVGKLRQQIADFLKVDSPNRILLEARDGMRRGPLQGNDWETRQLRQWLCTSLAVSVMPPKGFVILIGQGREYVSHADQDNTLRSVKGRVRYLVLDVVHHGQSRNLFPAAEVKLTLNGKRVPWARPTVPGATYRFDLPSEAAKIFDEEETWILSKTKTCEVCCDDKKATEMPMCLTSTCDHAPKTCKDCFVQWVTSSLDTTTWDALRCPECPALLSHADVQRLATPAVFARYDRLATVSVLENIPNFHWCLSTKCEAGQIQGRKCGPIFKCLTCKSRHCIVHKVRWHKGETCAQYDKRHKKQLKDERASLAAVKGSSKPCPGCQAATYKFDGCNHITCTRCLHEWCYVCAAPFLRNQHEFLYCIHRPGCTEHDPFANLVAPGADRNRIITPEMLDAIDRPDEPVAGFLRNENFPDERVWDIPVLNEFDAPRDRIIRERRQRHERERRAREQQQQQLTEDLRRLARELGNNRLPPRNQENIPPGARHVNVAAALPAVGGPVFHRIVHRAALNGHVREPAPPPPGHPHAMHFGDNGPLPPMPLAEIPVHQPGTLQDRAGRLPDRNNERVDTAPPPAGVENINPFAAGRRWAQLRARMAGNENAREVLPEPVAPRVDWAVDMWPEERARAQAAERLR